MYVILHPYSSVTLRVLLDNWCGLRHVDTHSNHVSVCVVCVVIDSTLAWHYKYFFPWGVQAHEGYTRCYGLCFARVCCITNCTHQYLCRILHYATSGCVLLIGITTHILNLSLWISDVTCDVGCCSTCIWRCAMYVNAYVHHICTLVRHYKYCSPYVYST